jgi:hypothetical protein
MRQEGRLAPKRPGGTTPELISRDRLASGRLSLRRVRRGEVGAPPVEVDPPGWNAGETDGSAPFSGLSEFRLSRSPRLFPLLFLLASTVPASLGFYILAMRTS